MNDEIEYVSRRYWVTSPHEVLGHPPGTDFEATLHPDQEAFYLTGGHLSMEPPVEETEEEQEQTGTPRGADDNPEEEEE